jgi:ParB/RepB/Spo0J family partition protein
MLSREIVWLDPAIIVVELDERQRKQELDVSDLIPSIREKGILLPLIVEDETLKIVAGWRRLTAAKFLEMHEVPCRIVAQGTSEFQLQMIEWEENAKRKDLTWQDNARAQWNLHQMCIQEHGEDWSVEQTAMILKQSEKHTYKMLDLGEALAEGDKSILEADTLTAANTILTRRRERAKGEAVNRILEMDDDDTGNVADDLDNDSAAAEESGDKSDTPEVQDGGSTSVPGSVRGPDPVLRPERKVAPPYAITHADAHEFLAGYSGPKFNFLHCDLP